MALTQEQVKKIYVGYLGRGADNLTPEALNLFESEAQLASFIFNSDEAKSKPGYPSILTIETVSAYINQIYQNLFGRAADDAAAGAQLVLSGVIAVDQVALFIANQAVPGSSDYDNLQRAIAQNKPVGLIGDTFMLTEGVDYADAGKSTHDNVADTFKFTDASETITATFAQLSKGDQLIDLSNADNDTLALSLDINNVKQTIGSKNGATLVNIEELDITSRGAKNITFDNTISAAGLKTIKIAGSFLNEKGNDGNGFTFNGNVLKTLTTIDASAITAGNVNIDASKATQDLTITGPNFAASINGGSGNDTITGQGTINAGAGDDIITITGKSDVTGGEGKDTFDVQAGKVTITDLGAGKDIIKVAAGAEVTATVTGQFVVSESNYVNDGSVTFKVAANGVLDLSEADGNITSIEITGTGAKVVGTVGDDTITVGSGASGTVEGGEGDDTITLASGHAATTIVFAATAAANGEDTITGFKAGSSADVLNVAALLGKPAVFGDNASGSGSSADTTTVASGKNVVVLQTNAAETNDKIKFTDAGKYVVIVEASGGSGDVYYYNASASETVTVSDFATTFTKVATVGTTVSSLSSDNFA